jgi:hypothetical protein
VVGSGAGVGSGSAVGSGAWVGAVVGTDVACGFGAWPAKNRSLRQPGSPGRIAVSPQTSPSSMPSGRGKSCGGRFSVSNETCIACGQIRPAVIELSACFIGSPLVLPTQTTMARLGV